MIVRCTILAIVALVLAACGAASAPQAVSPAVTLPPAPTAAPAPTSAPEATVAPEATAAPTPTSAPPATAAPIPTSAPPATAVPAASGGGELLFLRGGALMAFDMGTRAERQLAAGVAEFAAAPDGRSIAVVAGQPETDLWVIQRDGSGMRQLTTDGNGRAEAGLSWAPDSAALAYAASAITQAYAHSWAEWSAWCAASQVYVRDVRADATQNLGPGCDPAISPDGKRVAFATPPTIAQEGAGAPNAGNSIRLVNRQGQNGWSFASASAAPDAAASKQGLLVYAPAWSPDGTQLAYQRFVGYRALVDLNLTEIGGSFEGKGQPLSDGAGWMLPPRFAPGGGMVALAENNFSDARGFGGYDNWSVSVLRLGGTHELVLPEGSITALGQPAGQLPRAQAAAWSPDGAELAVLLPPGWAPGQSTSEPFGHEGEPGAIWRWRPGEQPAEQLAANVDFASPLAWLAPAQ